jgi:hypothetical protein
MESVDERITHARERQAYNMLTRRRYDAYGVREMRTKLDSATSLSLVYAQQALRRRVASTLLVMDLTGDQIKLFYLEQVARP